MKRWPILAMALETEHDVVAVRRKARRIAALLTFDTQDQTRIATAVSEIARNAQSYAGGGRVEFSVEGVRLPEQLSVRVSDHGPGIADIHAALEGRLETPGGMGLGLSGARRLMDAFALESRPGEGVCVTLGKRLPSGGVGREGLAEISRALAAEAANDPIDELRAQNQELIGSLQALEARRIEAVHLSEELERTNKGVVALYAELDRRALELQELNATLEQRVADGIAERARVEETLRQSQKMEAVGQLTGGVAHDFNNLLMVIGGSLELLRRRVPAEPAIIRLLDAASQGVARGGALNQQLLAFARRQDLREEVICINRLAPAFLQLIERAVSEDIAIKIEKAPGLWRCRTDPHQLETAVLNLAINARDAMPDGGVLTVAMANRRVDPQEAAPWEADGGDYVVVGVEDTGAGMPPEVLARVFEPFFTTKGVGRGTGLGLSQVYGFAKQSGGFVSIDSERGRGTRVRIHLPSTNEDAPAPQSGETPSSLVRGDAVVLVVEDDPAVRATTADMLRDLGYQVMEAADGRMALETIRSTAVDLVFTDVVLPGGLNGADVAREVRALAPSTAVLLTSGYTARLVDLDQISGVDVLSKPYDEARLSEAVRKALQGPR